MKTEVSLLGLKNSLFQTTTPKPKININNKTAAGRDCTSPFEAVYCMPPVLCSSHVTVCCFGSYPALHFISAHGAD
jgi:hypothetical protein